MPATYDSIFQALWPWLVSWGVNGEQLRAARLFSAYCGTADDDDDDAVDDSVDLDTTIGAMSQTIGDMGFARLRAHHQKAYIELITRLQAIGLDFDPNHDVSLVQNRTNNPAVEGFFIAEFLALCRDLRVFGPLHTFKPEKTLKNVLRLLKSAKNR